MAEPEKCEESDLSPADEKALDRVWEEIHKEGLRPPSKFFKAARSKKPSDTPSSAES